MRINRPPFPRTRAVVPALAVALALTASGCGNRLPEDQLRAEAGLTSVVPAADPAAAGPETGATAQVPAAATGSAPDVGTAAQPSSSAGVPAGAGRANGATPATGPNAPGPGSTPKAAVAAACTGTKAPIVIGTVGQQSGPLGIAFVNGTKAMNAWVASINATGGLGCHPVKYIVGDDGGDPSRHLSLVRQFVEQQGVVAFVYQDALLTGQASQKYLESKGIPSIGQEGGEIHTYDSPYYFNHASSGPAVIDLTVAAAARVGKAEGKKVFGTLTCTEVSYCSTADEHWSRLAGTLGLDLVYRGKSSLVNVDFTSQCLAAKDKGVELLAVAYESTAIHRIAQSCASVGYEPIIVCTSVQSNLDFATDENLDRAVVAQPLLPWFLSDQPAIQAYQSTLKKYAPGLPFDAASLNGWGAAQLFRLAGSAFAADTVTSEAIVNALAKVKNNDLGGLTYPLTFTPGKPQEQKVCGWVVRVVGGKFTSDGKRFCQ